MCVCVCVCYVYSEGYDVYVCVCLFPYVCYPFIWTDIESYQWF